MIGIFKQKNPVNLLLLLVFGTLIKLPMFFHVHIPAASPSDGILFQWILKIFKQAGNSSPIVYSILAFTLLFFQSILLTRIVNNRRMLSVPGYLPAMSYLLITSFFPEWNFFSAPLLTNTIFLFVLSGILKMFNQQKAKAAIFNIGLALGIAGFLLFSSLTFIAWILLALAIMRPFQLNEWLLCILGVATPFYFYGVYLFLTDQWDWNSLVPFFTVSIPSIEQSAWLSGSAFLIMIPFLAGGFYIQNNLRKMLIQVRKGWSLILLYLLAASFVPFVNTNNSFENWVLAAVPLAAFHSCAYLYSKVKVFPPILFWLSVAFVVAYQYCGPGW